MRQQSRKGGENLFLFLSVSAQLSGSCVIVGQQQLFLRRFFSRQNRFSFTLRGINIPPERVYIGDIYLSVYL